MSLIHNGINTRHFVSDDAARRTTRKAFGVSDDETVFLALGYNPRIKGVDIFMEAAAKAVEQGAAKSIFVVIGRDATRDFVAQRPECARLGASLRIIAPTERFGELLNGIDVLVSPSRSEGFSYALAEAMSSQKLVLVSDILGMREIYGRAHGAWLYTPHNSAALANLIARVGRLSVNERAHLGEMNRNYIVERHSLETWCEAMGNLYATLLPAVARGLE
jgi:glycosyltransferase involved in cell wall biosynthesis